MSMSHGFTDEELEQLIDATAQFLRAGFAAPDLDTIRQMSRILPPVDDAAAAVEKLRSALADGQNETDVL